MELSSSRSMPGGDWPKVQGSGFTVLASGFRFRFRAFVFREVRSLGSVCLACFRAGGFRDQAWVAIDSTCSAHFPEIRFGG